MEMQSSFRGDKHEFCLVVIKFRLSTFNSSAFIRQDPGCTASETNPVLDQVRCR